jgi:hypothetical protein
VKAADVVARDVVVVPPDTPIGFSNGPPRSNDRSSLVRPTSFRDGPACPGTGALSVPACEDHR